MQGTNGAGTALNHWFGVSQFGDMVWTSDGNSQQPLTLAIGYTGLLSYNRLWAQFGSAITNSDVAISSGWGSTATYTVRGDDTFAQINITANGAGIGVSPFFTITYHDGTFTTGAALTTRCDNSAPQGTGSWIANASATTSVTVFLTGVTPTAGSVYCANVLSVRTKN
jgi:hypothetical protein